MTTTIEIPVPGGSAEAYVAGPDDRTAPGVLFYMDAFGLRPQLRSMSDRLAGEGYTVLVPNLFYRHGPAPVVELPEFIEASAREGIFEKLRPLGQTLPPAVAMRDAGAYLRWLAGNPHVADGPVALTGYCFGARLSLLTAGTYPERVAAAAGFHSAPLATDDPDSPHLVAHRVTAELYFGHADNDPSMPVEQQKRLLDALGSAGVRHRCEVYEGAAHGFTMADISVYDPEADARHWAALLDLLRRTF